MTIDGSWEMVTKTPMGDTDSTLVVTSTAGVLSGTMDGPEGELPIFDGHVEGDSFGFKMNVIQPLKMTVEFNGTVEGDALSGKAKAGPLGSSPFSGTRV